MGKKTRHIVSTKLLSQQSIDVLENAGFSLESYDIMDIIFKENDALIQEISSSNDPFVFTSKNGVFAAQKLGLSIRKVFAIEPVTSRIAEELGYEIIQTGKDAHTLAEKISSTSKQGVIHLTCPDRRTELDKKLKEKNIPIHTVEVYEKFPNPKHHEAFDLLFLFAPSHLIAFEQKNKIKDQKIYCIGKTTADFARSKGYKNVTFCEFSSENNLVQLAIQEMTNEY